MASRHRLDPLAPACIQAHAVNRVHHACIALLHSPILTHHTLPPPTIPTPAATPLPSRLPTTRNLIADT